MTSAATNVKKPPLIPMVRNLIEIGVIVIWWLILLQWIANTTLSEGWMSKVIFGMFCQDGVLRDRECPATTVCCPTEGIAPSFFDLDGDQYGTDGYVVRVRFLVLASAEPE